MRLFCFGYGYVAQHVAALARQKGNLNIAGTRRLPADQDDVFAWQCNDLSAAGQAALQDATHLLISVPPNDKGCPVWRALNESRLSVQNLRSIGYLSTTGLYGDLQGGWADETLTPRPAHARSVQRVLAERQWQDWGDAKIVPVQIFRLSGIYGPPDRDGTQRSPFDRIQQGDGRIIEAPYILFNRVHVADIAQTVLAGAQQSAAGIFNVSDDLPCPQADVIRFAYDLLRRTPPEPVLLSDAVLSPMARDFYSESKRVCNEKIKRELGVTLKYPTYVEGLSALYRAQLDAGANDNQPTAITQPSA